MIKRHIKTGLPAAAPGLTAKAVAPGGATSQPTPDAGRGREVNGGQKGRPAGERREEIREKVDQIVMSEFGVERERVGPDVRFCKDYGAHSVHLIEFFVRLEDTFGLEIPDEDAQDIHYIRDVYSYVEKRLRSRKQQS